MRTTNFKYDNQFLSDYGFVICTFDGSSNGDTIDIGQKITFNTSPIGRGKRHSLAGVRYEDCIQTTFEICKNPNIYDDMTIGENEYREIVRWLNRHTFLPFSLCDCNNIPTSCYFDASFNIGKILVGERLCGIELEMHTNSPFGYEDKKKESYEFAAGEYSNVWVVKDYSDETGYLYPDEVKVTCLESGNLSIVNKTMHSDTHIRNCSEGEVILFNGITMEISTSNKEHDVYNDFNYDYFKIGNTFDNRRNEITVSLRCKIELTYRPIVKNIPV